MLLSLCIANHKNLGFAPNDDLALSDQSTVCMKEAMALSCQLIMQGGLWSDWEDVHVDLSCCWAQSPKHWICHVEALTNNVYMVFSKSKYSCLH